MTLLDGVTGSGKTEVYFEAVAENIRRGQQTLILMPEIALTAQLLDRFTARFGVRPAEWHSQLSPRMRARTWAAVAANEVSVVVGARSALFLPYADLGLIVVDEEHDPAYKQEDGAHYHARDMAVVRGSIAKIPVVLASATPSVESEVNARRGRYRHMHLPERFGGAHLPQVEAIDMRARRPAARPFHFAAARRSGADHAGERRTGAAVPQSPRLCAADTLPRLRLSPAMPELRCLAGRSSFQASGWSAITAASPCRRRRNARTATPPKASPPSAPASNGWSKKRPSCFPTSASWFCRAIWWNRSSDCAANSTTWRKAASISSSARNWSPRAIISRKLNLVGIVDADLGLGNGDPRAGERTFQLLHQVVGRAGREEGRGIGYLQTHQPEHPVMKALISRRPRGVLFERDRVARTHRLSAVRAAGQPGDQRQRAACGGIAMRARLASPRRTTMTCACSVPPKRRSRWCAAGIASACW